MISIPALALQTDRKTIIVKEENHAPLLARIGAELKLSGFPVHEQTLPQVPSQSDIETALRGASAFLFIRTLTGAIEIYYRTPEGQIFHLQVPLPNHEEEVESTAIHIAEVLRVALPPPPQEPAAPEPTVEKRRFSDQIVGSFAGSLLFGDLSNPPQIGFACGVGVQFSAWLNGQITGLIPIRSMQFDEPEGDAGIHAGSVGAAITLMSDRGRLRPLLRLGYQLWIFHATVTAQSGLAEHPGNEVTSGPSIYVGAVVALDHRLGIELDMGVSTTLAALQYDIADRTIAEIGRPMLEFNLGLAILPKEPR